MKKFSESCCNWSYKLLLLLLLLLKGDGLSLLGSVKLPVPLLSIFLVLAGEYESFGLDRWMTLGVTSISSWRLAEIFKSTTEMTQSFVVGFSLTSSGEKGVTCLDLDFFLLNIWKPMVMVLLFLLPKMMVTMYVKFQEVSFKVCEPGTGTIDTTLRHKNLPVASESFRTNDESHLTTVSNLVQCTWYAHKAWQCTGIVQYGRVELESSQHIMLFFVLCRKLLKPSTVL